MYCISCKYDLSRRPTGSEGDHRCPECGRAFDPSDPKTYNVRPDIRAWKLWLFLNNKLRDDWVPAYWLIFIILVFVLFLIAYL